MSSRRIGEALGPLRTILQGGAAGGYSDAELLDRFADAGGRGRIAEAAFATLMERHGPLVLRTCRQVLGDWHDADDAFQATFLVLAQKAGGIRRQEALGSWLHGVATRIASRHKVEIARRRNAERTRAEQDSHGSTPSSPPELVPELHEEIARLPEKYRAPVILCYLEGRTWSEAATRLGWPRGTLKVRLSRARALLRERLERRGLDPGFLLLLKVSAPFPPSSALQTRTLELLTASLASRSTTVAIPATVLAMIQGELGTMMGIKIVSVTALFASVALAWGISGPLATKAPPAIPSNDDEGDIIPVVFDPSLAMDDADSDREDSELLLETTPKELRVQPGTGVTIVIARDENQNPIKVVVDGHETNTLREVPMRLQWVVITGVLDPKDLKEDFGRRAPDFRRVEVQRQHLKPDGAWSAWEMVDRRKVNAILGDVAYQREERIRPEAQNKALLDILPYIEVEGDAWEETDRERFLVEVKWFEHLANELESDMMFLLESGLVEVKWANAVELLVRKLDLTVEPGLWYRYRLRIVVEDPQVLEGERYELFGRWSEPTEPVSVPPPPPEIEAIPQDELH